MEGYENQDRIIYEKAIKAGKRTYFLDVKSTKSDDYYLVITESKKKIESDGRFSYVKHKIFLYKEDFEKFKEGLEDVMKFILTERPDMPVRTPYLPSGNDFESKSKSDNSSENPKKDNSDYFSGVNFEDL